MWGRHVRRGAARGPGETGELTIRRRYDPKEKAGVSAGLLMLHCAGGSAFRGRDLAAAALIDVGDTAAHVHEAATIVGVGLGAAMLMGSKAGTGRDQATDDDVLLEAAQVVLEATHRRLREDAGGLLERGRRDERLG